MRKSECDFFTHNICVDLLTHLSDNNEEVRDAFCERYIIDLIPPLSILLIFT